MLQPICSLCHFCTPALKQLPRQLPEVPAWQSNGSYPATPLDELELNCTNPAEASACQKAASSNAYEGGTAPLDPAELAELQSFLEAPSQQADSSAGAQQDLDELNLDCGSNPEACAAVAEETNSYSGTTDASYTAVAEAAEYLSTVNAHQAWDAVVGYAPELGPDSANTYEGAEQQWVGTRNAEEAGPQYLDVSALNLDCNKAAAESDVMTEAECERSVASNRYETPAPTNQDPGLTAAEIALSMQLRQRTEGYDAVALEWEEFAAQQSAPTAAEEQPGAAIQRFLLQQQLLQDVAESGRVTGYDVPAVDEMEPTSAPAPPAGAPAAAPVQIDNRLGARQYFKQPCNCPAAQQEYKNRFSHPGHRVYYKNPANAPATFEDMGEGQVAPGPAALPATTVPYLAALATIAASAAGTWYMMTRDKKRPAKPADEIEAQGGEGAEQHAVTSPMASGMSCELPHFDLKTGRASTLHTALPAIDEPEDDDYPDELDYTYKRSNSAGRSSPKALIEGMTSGMSRRLRESDYGSDTVLEGPSNLQSRPSMVADVERRTEQPRVRFASPSTSREGAGSPFKQK
eukprot:GHUV01020331.1.p1 GENE.GHUV01020331.1~~GHUV01020331.1.p1  ORF type:complete len:575 (+),score=192.92 GHUV01020331.1:1403-3127(+)